MVVWSALHPEFVSVINSNLLDHVNPSSMQEYACTSPCTEDLTSAKLSYNPLGDDGNHSNKENDPIGSVMLTVALIIYIVFSN